MEDTGEKFDADAYLAEKRENARKYGTTVPPQKPTSSYAVYTRQQAAFAWMKGLGGLTVFFAIVAFLWAGNTFGTYDFEPGAAFGAAIGATIPFLPWIGLFHVLGRWPNDNT